MEIIRDTISKNIIALRKANGHTQIDLARKINYSDKAVSRWEKGEVIPDVETLQKIAENYSVPLTYLLEEHENVKNDKLIPSRNELILHGLFICIAWIIITVLFVYLRLIYDYLFWQAFIWGIPITCALTLWANKKWGNAILKMIIQTIFVWSLITAFYLQFLNQNLWLIFLIGIPIQAAIIVSFFIKPEQNKTKK